MNDKKILAAIESLREDIGGRLDSIEQRLDASEKGQKKQGKDIDTLFQRLDTLCEDKPIWKSRDGRETAVRTEDADSVFRKTGFSPREALRIINEAERLARDPDGVHYKKAVRAKEIGRVRAVVILSEDEI
jgi:hypothetical protein